MHEYDWQRLWYPTSSDIYLEPEGFLVDPESSLGRCFNHFSSETRLIAKIFEHESFREWQESNSILHLFLDALDEGMIAVDTPQPQPLPFEDRGPFSQLANEETMQGALRGAKPCSPRSKSNGSARRRTTLDPRQFSRLDHPGLDEQLASFLRNPERAFGARLTAICLAGACKRPDLVKELLRLALDTAEEISLRTSSIAALAQVGDQTALRRLRSLLPGDQATKEDHWIGVNVIRALWPDALSTKELLETFRRADESDCLGKYSSFFYGSRVLDLKSVDLPMALAWVAENRPHQGRIEGTYRSILLAVFNRAWSLIESPGVASAFAQAIARMTHDHSSAEVSKFLERFVSETARRHRLLGALFEVAELEAFPYFSTPWEMILQEDSAWFVTQFESARSERTKALLSRLIARTFDAQDQELFERIHPLAEAEEILREALRESIGPIDLSSGLADSLRRTYERNQKWAAERAAEEARRSSQIPTSQQIEDLLDRAEAGDAECWWRINHLLGFDDEHREMNLLDGQITEAPGWAEADPAKRRRLLFIARQYLLHADPVKS